MNDSHNVYKLTSLDLEEPINHKYRLSYEDIDQGSCGLQTLKDPLRIDEDCAF